LAADRVVCPARVRSFPVASSFIFTRSGAVETAALTADTDHLKGFDSRQDAGRFAGSPGGCWGARTIDVDSSIPVIFSIVLIEGRMRMTSVGRSVPVDAW
jgi:hypothetical protein